MTLQRYNQIAIAVTSTVALMGILILIAFAIFQSLSHREPQGLAVRHDDKPKPKQNLVLCAPARVSGSEYEYIAVGAVVQRDADETPSMALRTYVASVDYGESKFADCGLSPLRHSGRIFNVVIRNVRTGEERMLLSQPGQIETLNVPGEKCDRGEGSLPCGWLLWTIRPADSNNDGLINGRDAVVAYVSELSAVDLKQVTPSDATVLSRVWSPEDHSLIFQIRRDTNGDKEFTDEDGSDLLRVDLEKPVMGVALLTDTTKKKLEEALR